MTTVRTLLAVVLLTIVAAGAGVWVGMGVGDSRGHRHSGSLDEILHHEIGLTQDQEKRIASLESKFALDRKDLEAQMRAANLELARALERERAYGEAAKSAISHFHDAMAKLQELTILHVLEMRAVLSSEQAERFDKTVRDALSAEPP